MDGFRAQETLILANQGVFEQNRPCQAQKGLLPHDGYHTTPQYYTKLYQYYTIPYQYHTIQFHTTPYQGMDGFRAQELPQAGTQHLPTISSSGIWRKACSFELQLPPLPTRVYHLQGGGGSCDWDNINRLFK